MQAVVLAGGLATRMRPATLTLPKSMLEVAGRPFVDWQLERLAASGIREVVMCVAHLGEQIRAHVGNGARFGVSVEWSDEGPNLLGTAGAIRQALDRLAPAFVVTYGDSYLPFDYSEPLAILERESDCDGVMAVYKNQGAWDASNVVTDGTWVRRYAKNQSDPAFDHIDYGATALRRTVFESLGVGQIHALDALQADLARRGRLRASLAHARFFEIGSPQGLDALDHYLRQKASP